jgi:hypothetical protein
MSSQLAAISMQLARVLQHTSNVFPFSLNGQQFVFPPAGATSAPSTAPAPAPTNTPTPAPAPSPTPAPDLAAGAATSSTAPGGTTPEEPHTAVKRLTEFQFRALDLPNVLRELRQLDAVCTMNLHLFRLAVLSLNGGKTRFACKAVGLTCVCLTDHAYTVGLWD